MEAESRVLRAKRRILTVDRVPGLSPALESLFALLDADQSSASDLEGLIAQDPGICSQVLRVANSAYYGCRGKISSAARAIVVLGFREIRNICLHIALMQNFDRSRLPVTFDTSRFWQHSMLTAFLASELAAGQQALKKEEAYVMGLLHDLGRVAMAAYLPHDFTDVVRQADAAGGSLFEAETASGLTHTEVGAWLAVKWSLPPDLQIALKWHHDPLRAPAFNKEAAIVHLADRLTRLADGMYVERVEPVYAAPPREIIAQAGLAEDDILGLTPGIETLANEVLSRGHNLSGA